MFGRANFTNRLANLPPDNGPIPHAAPSALTQAISEKRERERSVESKKRERERQRKRMREAERPGIRKKWNPLRSESVVVMNTD